MISRYFLTTIAAVLKLRICLTSEGRVFDPQIKEEDYREQTGYARTVVGCFGQGV
jgi:hypothetical protein